MKSSKGDRLSQAMQLISARQAEDHSKQATGRSTRHRNVAASKAVNAKDPQIEIIPRLRDEYQMVEGDDLPSSIRNEYRRIKRPLLSNAFGKSSSLVDQGNLIVVTSSVPGEGKTYTTINLALTLAKEQDHTVLMVDCDVTKRGLSRMLGVESWQADITDLLVDDRLTVGEALLKTEIPGLALLPAVKPNEAITELMASRRMAKLVHEIANRYKDRIVIFDAPPTLSTPETQVLTSLSGQIVFVIEASKTPRGVVDDALETLPEDKSIGLVLNKSESITNHGGYYHNYYQPYGPPEDEAHEPAASNG